MSMPSYWFDPFVGGSGGVLGGTPNVAPAMSAGQINASMGFNPNAAQFNPFANTPGGFGGLTNAYSAAGAAYGRATGGFGGYGAANADPFTAVPSGGGYPSGAVQRGPDLPQPDLGGYNPIGTPQYDAWTGAITGYSGGGIGSDMLRGGQNGPANPYAQMYRMPAANPSYFNPGGYGGDQGSFGIPYRGAPLPGDIGFSRQPQMPNLGYNPSMQHQFANPTMGGGAFQGRFGMGFPNAGTPSQYAPGAQMPPGFLSPYSVDNPQGALPLGWNNSFNN